MKVTIDVDETDIVSQSLKEHYIIQVHEIERIENKDDPSSADVEDLNYMKIIRDSIKILLTYYLNADDYKQFIRSLTVDDITADEDGVGYPRS